MQATRLFFAILCIPFFLFGCTEDPSKEIIGAWKSQKNDSLSGTPRALIIEEKRLLTGLDSVEITFMKKDGKILIIRAGESQPIYIVRIIDKNSASFINHALGEDIFIRTTSADVKAIQSAPSKLQSKPDPF